MGIYKQIDDASLEQLQQLWNADTPDWADTRESLLEELAYALCNFKPEGPGFLKIYVRSSDIELRRAAIWFLAYPDTCDDDTVGYLLDAFSEDDLRLKTIALWGCIHIECYPIPQPEIEKLMEHSNERIAALAMTYLSYANPNEAIDILRNGLLSSNPRKREYACDEVGDRNLIPLKDYVARLVDDPDEYVQQAADTNLNLLAED